MLQALLNVMLTPCTVQHLETQEFAACAILLPNAEGSCRVKGELQAVEHGGTNVETCQHCCKPSGLAGNLYKQGASGSISSEMSLIDTKHLPYCIMLCTKMLGISVKTAHTTERGVLRLFWFLQHEVLRLSESQ